MTDLDNDILSEDETDDGIIELTDIVSRGSEHLAQENIIELIDIIEDDDSDIVGEVNFDLEENLEIDDEIAFNEGLELEVGDRSDDDSVETEDVMESAVNLNVSQEQVEAALERVIEKKITDKVETILFSAMEKVLEKEIAGIKKRLQKDFDQIGNL